MVLFFCCQQICANNVQLDGVIQDLIFNADGTLSQHYTNSFHLAIYNEKWVCKTTFGDYAEELAFDGTNTYTQHYFPPPKAGTILDAHTVNTAEITTAEIRRGSSCVDGLPTTRILWLAFCGKPFFERGFSAPIVSPWGHPSLLGADSMTYSIDLLDKQYMIPKELRFIMSYEFWKKELNNKHRDADEPNPFNDKEVVAEYNVLSYTNMNGVALPTDFELVRYSITRSRKPVILESFHGNILSIIETEGNWMLPALHMKAGVQDFRFSTVEQPWLHISYNTPRDQWLETNDPIVLSGLHAAITNYASFEKKLYKKTNVEISYKKRTMAIYVILAVFMCPPLIYILAMALKRIRVNVKK
jgi:hypothetical protein